MCKIDFEPANLARSNACGAQNKVGATSNNTSGRQNSCINRTGKDETAKLAKCKIRFKAVGRMGT